MCWKLMTWDRNRRMMKGTWLRSLIQSLCLPFDVLQKVMIRYLKNYSYCDTCCVLFVAVGQYNVECNLLQFVVTVNFCQLSWLRSLIQSLCPPFDVLQKVMIRYLKKLFVLWYMLWAFRGCRSIQCWMQFVAIYGHSKFLSIPPPYSPALNPNPKKEEQPFGGSRFMEVTCFHSLIA